MQATHNSTMLFARSPYELAFSSNERILKEFFDIKLKRLKVTDDSPIRKINYKIEKVKAIQRKNKAKITFPSYKYANMIKLVEQVPFSKTKTKMRTSYNLMSGDSDPPSLNQSKISF